MVRSVGIAAVVLGLAWSGLAGAQSYSPSQTAPPRQRYITVREQGKPPQRCKLVKSWRELNGTPVFQVQAVESGEMMTILGSSPSAPGGDPRAMSTRIFRWGNSNKPPVGAPQAPGTAAAKAAPSTPPALPKTNPMATPQLAKTPQSTPMPVISRKPETASTSKVGSALTTLPVVKTPQPTPMPVISRKSEPTSPSKVGAIPATPQLAKTPQSTPATLTARKSEPASSPQGGSAKTTSIGTPPAITAIKPGPSATPAPSKLIGPTNSRPLTPMDTQVVQQPTARKPEVRNSTPSASPQPRLVPSASGVVVGQTPGDCGCPPACKDCCQSCNSCGQPSCVCCSPSPMRQSFISRLFKSQRCDCPVVACQPAPAPVAAPKPAATLPPAPAVAKVETEPAKPRDWRESWGKVEPWKEKKDTAKAAPVPVKPVEPPTERVASKPVQLEAPKDPNPIKNPDMFRDMAISARPANSKIPDENQGASRPKSRLLAALRSLESKPSLPPSQPPAAVASAAKTPNAPPPSSSPGRGVELPANEGNAFWSPPKPPTPSNDAKSKYNAFERDENSPPPQGGQPRMAAGYNGPLPPPGPMPMVRQPRSPMMPSRPDMGVPDAMGNAFTLPGTRRPIPADFGGTPQEPNGFDPRVQMGQGSPPQAYGMAGMPMPRPPMPNMMAMGPRPPMGFNPLMSVPPTPVAPVGSVADARSGAASQLLAKLQDALYPSERELAAEQLSQMNCRVQPQVVAGLMKSARDDPAATVRAACVHALAQMKISTMATVALVRDLKSDRDPRVRHEAEEALHAMGDSGIQQTSHK